MSPFHFLRQRSEQWRARESKYVSQPDDAKLSDYASIPSLGKNAFFLTKKKLVERKFQIFELSSALCSNHLISTYCSKMEQPMQRCNGVKTGGKPCTLSGSATDGQYFYCHHHKDQKEMVHTTSFPFTYHGSSCESIFKKVFIRIYHGWYQSFYTCSRMQIFCK